MRDRQTILIVDDVKENIDILIELLSDYDLVASLDVATALSIIEDEEIDLILLDIMMPVINGFDMCKQLKSNQKYSHIPIIFLSAKNKYKDIEKGFELGAVDYITKPFNPNELISRVDTHLRLRKYEKNLELQIKKEIKENEIKQQIIFQQSKQASLGELLMHIAHQWKQPLASLASINLLNKVKLESGTKITQKELLSTIDTSEKLIIFMSKTIDTFKNFYIPSTQDEDFFIYQALLDVISIMKETLKYNNIDITIKNYEKIQIFTNKNEFEQVIFSILTNAHDIFKLRKIENPKIEITIYDKKITISDNGGGIDNDKLQNIFLANISGTNGTGIGLYLSKTIIIKNNGNIYAKNNSKGATFCIEIR